MLDGAKSVVTHGDCADRLVVSARTAGERDAADGITLFLVDADAPGVARRGYAARDEQRAADIALSNVRVSDADVLGEVGDGLSAIVARGGGRHRRHRRGIRRRDGGDERYDPGIL